METGKKPGPKLEPQCPKTEPVPTNKSNLSGKTGSILGPEAQYVAISRS